MLVDIIAGARPNFVKIAPIIRAIQERAAQGGPLRYRVVHPGQHYDARMSADFFVQLGIPAPDVSLKVGSGSQAEQTGSNHARYEELLLKEPSDLRLVPGDVTSTMACAITAKKLCLPVAHMEAGIRSGDINMPEEVNRIVTESITDWFFTTSVVANANLRQAGVGEDRIIFVCNTMIDTLLANMDRLEKPQFFDKLGLEPKGYFVTTLHLPANVDQGDGFSRMLAAIGHGARNLPVIFPAHPRTAKTLRVLGEVPANIHLVEPQPYLQFNWLVKNAFAVISDSGWITEETMVIGSPCLKLRDDTERPETLEIGTNMLIGCNPDALAPALDMLFDGRWKSGGISPLWDGQTAPRCVATLEQLLVSR